MPRGNDWTGVDPRLGCLVLEAAPGVGPRRARALLERFGSAVGALAAPPPELARAVGLGGDAAARLRASGWRARAWHAAVAELALAERRGASVLTAAHRDWPPALRELPDPPLALRLRGRLPPGVLRPPAELASLALVGSRTATPRALRFAAELATELATRGVVVVSGLALGVDGAAHRGALEAAGCAAAPPAPGSALPDGVPGAERGARPAPGGRPAWAPLRGVAPTVAVLGSGVLRPAPARHAALAERLLACGGALLSEFPLEAGARPEHFPRRNRLVSALARGVVVVEARAGSGARHTVDFALEQGRSVWVVPDHPSVGAARGGLELLRQGAAPLLGIDDLAAEFRWLAAPLPQGNAPAGGSPAAVSPSGADPDASLGTIPGAGPGEPGPPPGGSAAAGAVRGAALPPGGGRLLRRLAELGAAPPEQLAGRGVAPGELLALLTRLELDRWVVRLPGGRWAPGRAPPPDDGQGSEGSDEGK